MELEQKDVLPVIPYSCFLAKIKEVVNIAVTRTPERHFIKQLDKLLPVHTWALGLSTLAGMDQNFLRGFF